MEYRRGNFEESERQYQKSYDLLSELNDRPAIAECIQAIGAKRAAQRQYADAAAAFREGIVFAHRFGLIPSMVSMSERLAHIAFLQGKADRAVSLFAMAARKRLQFSRAMEVTTAAEMSELIELAKRSQSADADFETLDKFLEEASSVAEAID